MLVIHFQQYKQLFNWRLLFHSDHETLEKSRRELQQQLEILEQEAQHLRQSNTELQLKGDMADGEKEEKQDELERLMREREYM